MSSGFTVLPGSKETEIESSDQEASLLAGKNTEVVLVPCPWKCVHTAMFGCVDISEVPGCHFLGQVSAELESQNYFKMGYLMSSQTTSGTRNITEMVLLSKALKPDNNEF